MDKQALIFLLILLHSLKNNKFDEMFVALIFFITPLMLINSSAFNIQENSEKIKAILLKYKSNNRYPRSSTNTTQYIYDTVTVFKDTERYSEFLKYYNVSECASNNTKKHSAYVKRHILHGLLVDSDVPDSHWHEYKVSLIHACVKFIIHHFDIRIIFIGSLSTKL